MKKYRFSAILLVLTLLMSLTAPWAFAAGDALVTSGSEMSVEAGYAFLYNYDTKQIYFEQNADDKAYPASITKVMVALLVLEAVDKGQISLDQVVTASSTFSKGLSNDGSTVGIKSGEELTVEQLLYCLLLPSANEAANILAETVSGSVTDFVTLMNQKAQELGCTGTHFANACGLHDPDHYTTARDVCTFFCAAMANSEFMKLIGTDQVTIPATNLSAARTLYNTNALLTPLHYSGYTYSACLGGKTGSTNEAGYCLVCAAKKDGTTLVSVVLDAATATAADGSTKRMQFVESRRLLQWGFDNFSVKTILDSGSPMAEVNVTLSEDSDHVAVCPAEAISATLPNSLNVSTLTPTVSLSADSVTAPVTKGQVLGTVSVVGEDGTVYGTTDLVAMSDVSRSEFLYRISVIKDFFSHLWVRALLVLIIIAIVALILSLTVFRRNKRYGRRGSRTRSYRGGRRRR